MPDPNMTHDVTVLKLVPGLVGSFISLGFIKRSWPERMVMAVGGAALSYWGTDWATAFLGMQKAEGLVGFLIGLFGLAMVAKVYEVIAAIDAAALLTDLKKRFLGGGS